jgi:hypothetical protein
LAGSDDADPANGTGGYAREVVVNRGFQSAHFLRISIIFSKVRPPK